MISKVNTTTGQYETANESNSIIYTEPKVRYCLNYAIDGAYNAFMNFATPFDLTSWIADGMNSFSPPVPPSFPDLRDYNRNFVMLRIVIRIKIYWPPPSGSIALPRPAPQIIRTTLIYNSRPYIDIAEAQQAFYENNNVRYPNALNVTERNDMLVLYDNTRELHIYNRVIPYVLLSGGTSDVSGGGGGGGGGGALAAGTGTIAPVAPINPITTVVDDIDSNLQYHTDYDYQVFNEQIDINCNLPFISKNPYVIGSGGDNFKTGQLLLFATSDLEVDTVTSNPGPPLFRVLCEYLIL